MLPRFSRYGGVEQFGFRLAGLLAERGLDVDFICARREADPPPGVRVLAVGRPFGPTFLKVFWFCLAAERLRQRGDYACVISLGKTWAQDLLRVGGGPLRIFWRVTELAQPSGPAKLFKRLRRRLSPANWLTLLLEQRQYSGRSKIVAVSHLVRDWICQAHPNLQPQNIDIVYNKPDLGRYAPPPPEERAACRQALGLTPDQIAIGLAGSNFELKGVGPMIQALALLPDNFRLFVAGGRRSGPYQALADNLGVGDRVRFLGKVDDMPFFYKSLDIFILPSFYDACSNAVLEALACGLKVISSAANGSSRFLESRFVLPNPGDPKALAQTLLLAQAEPAPTHFGWPQDLPCGLEAFADLVEDFIRNRTV